MSDILKVCPNCNRDISSETGKCFYCSPVISENLETKINNNWLVALILSVNLPLGIIVFKWINPWLLKTLPAPISEFVDGLYFAVFAISFVASLYPTILFLFLIDYAVHSPKKAIPGLVEICKIAFYFIIALPIIIVAPFTIAAQLIRNSNIKKLVRFTFTWIFKISIFMFLGLLGLALIVFALKFIKSQLFN